VVGAAPVSDRDAEAFRGAPTFSAPPLSPRREHRRDQPRGEQTPETHGQPGPGLRRAVAHLIVTCTVIPLAARLTTDTVLPVTGSTQLEPTGNTGVSCASVGGLGP
jgi:hypothetical protein